MVLLCQSIKHKDDTLDKVEKIWYKEIGHREDGSPIGMQYRNSSYSNETFNTYWFEKNLQGDIIAVYNEGGTKLVSYTYDAWGNVTTTYHNSGASTAAQYNPFRYRGYYYDSELGFYYLNSRYYDPETGRFISPDTTDILTATPMALTDKNLFAYCDNNPIMRMDIGGEVWNVIVGTVVGAAISFVSSVVSELTDDDKNVNWSKIAVSTVIGGIEGMATAIAPGATMAISATASFVESIINDVIVGEDFKTVAVNSLMSAAIGTVGGSDGSDFIIGNKLINDAFGSVKNVINKSARPGVKKAAKNTMAQARKYIGKSYISGQISDLAFGGLSAFSSWYVNAITDRMLGR